jgi:hypothetical protein
MRKDLIPRPDSKFTIWLSIFYQNLSQIGPRIQFPSEVLNELAVNVGDFDHKFALSQDPATRTKVTIQDKRDSRKVVEKFVRQIIGEYLTKNHLVTNADREFLGIPIHKTTRTPVPVATEYPGIEIDTSIIRQIIIYFFPLGHKRSEAKPDGQKSVEIHWAISDIPVIDTGELTNSAIDTRSPFTIIFQGHERGKTVYFTLRWLNNRGEPGPWSEIVDAIIP